MIEWATTEEAAVARRLLRSRDSGVLSTMSIELPGYPFGSVTPYVMSPGGNIAVYVSSIAQHTANMIADPKVSLTVLEEGDGNRQALGRATVVGDASVVPGAAVDEVSARYFQFFPEARQYGGTHAFEFFWIEPRRVRYIGGFGKIYWIESGDWAVPTAGWSPNEGEVLAHMNRDHGDSLVQMARHFCGIDGEEVELVACDPEGCHLRTGSGYRYLCFERPALTAESLRKAMISLARTAT